MFSLSIQCLTWENLLLCTLNGVISALAFIQLLRLYLYTLPLRWTRQKVFHCLIGLATFGYCVYFGLSAVATCKRWRSWQQVYGFIVMSIPQILFLATFLLLLSFWVDLCHQASDKEEDEEDEIEEVTAEESTKDANGSTHVERYRRCCYWWRHRIHTRQKFVIAVVMLIFLITIAFAIVIWIGLGDNPIDSDTVDQIYSDLFALVIFLSGGGLAGYGLALYTRMSRSRVGKTSADLQKVAGLAVVTVLCFSIRALFVLLSDIDVLKKHEVLVMFFYYLIGEVIPCMVVLWVMRNNPSRSSTRHIRRSAPPPVSGYQQVLAQEQALLQQLIVPDDLESIVVVSRGRRNRPGKTDSEGGGSASNSA